MSCLEAFLNSNAVLYDVDRTGETDSGQPTEVLTQVRTQKVFFQPYALRNPIYQLFNAGKVKTGDYFCISLKLVSLNQVISVAISNDEKFLITNVFPLQAGKKVLAYQLSLERYRH